MAVQCRIYKISEWINAWHVKQKNKLLGNHEVKVYKKKEVTADMHVSSSLAFLNTV